MAQQPQNFQNHVRWVPAWHIGVFGIFVINFFWSIYRLLRHGFSGEAAVGLLMAVGLLTLFACTRMMIVTVQDRVIRLEMRLRLRDVLPADLKSRINELSPAQLVALRFASDAELPELVRDVLAGNLAKGRDIKMRIKNWQADWLRA